MPAPGLNQIRFGVFEVDGATGELRKRGVLIRLERQPTAVLRMLLEQPGEVVSREDLRSRLWPDGVHVDFDHNLNKAVGKLREALGDSATSPRFIETKPKQGYRFIAEVSRSGPNTDEPLEVATPVALEPEGSSRSHRSAAIAIAVAVVIVLATLGGIYAIRASAGIRSIAVLPFENVSGDTDQQYLSEGITQALTTNLAQIGSLSVIAQTSASRYRKTGKGRPEIARELDVEGLVEGSAQRRGDRVLVTARLIQASSGRYVWAQSYDRDLRDALALQSEIASSIAAEIRARLTPEEQTRLANPRSANPEAQELYLRAQYLDRQEKTERSFALFQQAVQKDPNFAAAYAAMPFGPMLYANFLPAIEGLAQWRAAIARALELDPNLAEAHRARGSLLGFNDWNWREAEREFRAAIRLNPNLAFAHQHYGMILSLAGSRDEGIAELRRAQRLDPFDLGVNTMLAHAIYFARKPEDLTRQADKLEDMNPGWAHLFRGHALELRGEFQKAITEMTPPPSYDLRVQPGAERVIAALAHAYAMNRQPEEARKLLTLMTEVSKQRTVPIQGFWFACVYAALGEKDRAFEFLERAYNERPSEMIGVGAYPDMDPLRSDPRFHALLQRMNLQ